MKTALLILFLAELAFSALVLCVLALSKAGHVCVVCWGWEQAWEAIEVYLCS